MQSFPNIVIIGTGGTIAGVAPSSTQVVGYEAAKVGVDQLIAAVPEIDKIANIKGEQIFQVASESMMENHWLKLAKRVNALLAQPDVDGIVITHGSDTLEETAYFLDLVVKSDKPVVLTAGMRPSSATSADGPMNIYNCVLVAGSKDSIGKGVLISLNDQIGSARNTTKTNTVTLDTFKSTDLGFLGYIAGGHVFYYNAPTRKHTVNTEFDVSKLEALPSVEIVYGQANANMIAANALVKSGVKGLIYAGPGDGSMSKVVKPAMAELRKQGTFVVRSTRVGTGPVARNGEANDDQLDFVVADNLNPQKARILLQLALTKTSDTKQIQRMFWEY